MGKKLVSVKLYLFLLLFVLINSCKKEDTPPPTIPLLNTTIISSITEIAATSGGTITSDGGGSITARGVCWSTNETPSLSDNFTVDGSGAGTFSSNMTGLLFATTYYVRAYATNSAGTGYGNQINFSTISTVTDINGNVYQTIKIGSQIWMAENLKVTKYRNGNAIPNITDNTQWSNLTTGAYCDYDNLSVNSDTYGRLYNWFTVIDSRNIAPAGWHVPTQGELTTLTTYVGGTDIAGGKLKVTGTTRWNSPNTGATNESGFSALGTGHRSGNGIFSDIGNFLSLYTVSEFNSTYSYFYRIYFDSPRGDFPYGTKKNGLSVRCLKD